MARLGDRPRLRRDLQQDKGRRDKVRIVGQGVDSENLLRWPAPGHGATRRRAPPAGMCWMSCTCCSCRRPFTPPVYASGARPEVA
jgi:hypothetical protein